MNQSKANKIRTSIESWTTSIFTIIGRLFIAALFIAVSVMLYKGLSNDNYLIQPFQVPGDFEEKGYNGVVLSRKIQDRVAVIKETVSSSKKDSIEFEADLKPDLEVGVMGFGLSLNTVTYHLKNLLGRKNKIITGELTDLNNKMDLTLRMSDFETKNFSFKYDGNRDEALDYLLEEAGKAILSHTDPYRLALYHYRKKEYRKALPIILDLLKEEKDEEWAYIAWGNILFEQGKKEEGIDKLKKALTIQPNFVTANVNLAWKYFELRDFDSAALHFKKIVELEPTNFTGLHGLAQSYRFAERNEEAAVAYDQLIAVHPDVIWAYSNKAQFMLRNLKDTVGAITLYQTAAEVSKDGIEKYTTLAGFYSTLQKYDTCHIYLDKVLEIEPNNAMAMNWKTGMFYNDQNYEKVFTFLEEIREISNDGFNDSRFQKQNSLNLMAMASYQLKKYEQAVAFAKESIAVYPDNGMPYTSLAEAYSYMGKDEQFYEALEEAFKRKVPPNVLLEDDAYQRFLNQKRFKDLVKKYEVKREPLEQVAKN